MHLTENESRLQDYLDGCLPLQEAQAIEAHLADCPECHALFFQWHELDAELARSLPKPTLSPDFFGRLRDQVRREDLEEKARTGERSRTATDYLARRSTLRRNFFRAQLPAFLDWLGYSTTAAVGAYLTFHLILGVLNAHFKGASLSPNQMMLGVSFAASGVFLIAGLGVAARKHLARWLDELTA